MFLQLISHFWRMKKNNSFPVLFFAMSALFVGCQKDESTTQDTPRSLKCKSYKIYEGEDLSELELSQSFSLQYNAQNQLVSTIESYYDESVLLFTTNYDYTYQPNLVIESVRYGTEKSYSRKSFLHLNAQSLVIKDSTVDYEDEDESKVIHYTYNNQNKRVYKYLSDTLDGGFVYTWKQNNIDQEFRISQMGRTPIISCQYNSSLNTIDLGDFWYNGEMSKNLLETVIESDYEYRWTHKTESDGFVSEQNVAISFRGGDPVMYFKFVYVR